MDLILQKAAFQSSHIFMHAVHIILSTIFTSLQTLYSNDKYNPLSVYTYNPNICHRFYIFNWKRMPLKHLSCWGEDEKKFYSFLRVWCLVCLCETGGQLLLQGRNNLNVNASRLARCKIITVLCVLAIRCRSLCTLLDCL